jgi:hypothetical protein
LRVAGAHGRKHCQREQHVAQDDDCAEGKDESHCEHLDDHASLQLMSRRLVALAAERVQGRAALLSGRFPLINWIPIRL